LARRFVRELALCLLLGVIAVAPYRALAAAGEKVSFKSGNDTVSGLLYTPSGGGKHPAIVVIHEWWGLNDWVKQQAEQLAHHGYVTLAVDLYRGHVATDTETAHELMRGLPQDQGVRDLTAAAAYLSSREDVDTSRIGAIGWCMGGGYAAQLAVADPELKAVSINYGALPTDPAALAAIHAAVLGNFGGQDKGITPASVEAFSSALKKMGKSVNVKIYPDAGHAFENPNNKEGYRKQDAEDAQRRSVNFFATTLGGTGE
jgi:carboxymethylenebutenolidase